MLLCCSCPHSRRQHVVNTAARRQTHAKVVSSVSQEWGCSCLHMCTDIWGGPHPITKPSSQLRPQMIAGLCYWVRPTPHHTRKGCSNAVVCCPAASYTYQMHLSMDLQCYTHSMMMQSWLYGTQSFGPAQYGLGMFVCWVCVIWVCSGQKTSLTCNQLHAGLRVQPSDGAAQYHQWVTGSPTLVCFA